MKSRLDKIEIYIQQIINELRKVKKEKYEAKEYARNLAIVIHKKFYSEVTAWDPYDDLLGLLTQIDDMCSGIERKN